jgi:hypothetical protein
MHTTSLLPGKALPPPLRLQSDALAFQFVVPVVGPTQVSVQAGWAAPLGVAVTRDTTPAEPNDAIAAATATANLGNLSMMFPL